MEGSCGPSYLLFFYGLFCNVLHTGEKFFCFPGVRLCYQSISPGERRRFSRFSGLVKGDELSSGNNKDFLTDSLNLGKNVGAENDRMLSSQIFDQIADFYDL